MYVHHCSIGRQRGFSLIEFGFVVILMAIAAMIVVGQFGGSKADSDAKTEGEVFMNIYTKVLDSKSGGSYGPAGADLVPGLIVKRAIPSSYTIAGNAVSNRYQGPFTATSAGGTALVTTANIPPEACVEVAKRASAGGAGSVQINGASHAAGAIQDAVAATACSQQGNANSVTAVTPN